MGTRTSAASFRHFLNERGQGSCAVCGIQSCLGAGQALSMPPVWCSSGDTGASSF